MRAPPRRILVAAQIAAVALLFYFVGRTLADQWVAIKSQRLETDLGVASLIASAAAVFAGYALLVQIWRMMIASAGGTLAFWPAFRIWAVSGLWRYVPGKVWSIGAMSALAQRENVPAVTAAGSAVLNTVVNIAAGLAITLVLAWRWLSQFRAGAQPVAILLLVVTAVGLLALPYALPRLAVYASRMTGRDVVLRVPPPWALALSVAGNIVAWALYGVAFMWLIRGVLGDAPGAPWQYIAVFTASYVVGYLFLIVPGGIGPREAVMFELMTTLGLAPAKEAVLVTVASRVWLTILEILPGLAFLAFNRGGSRPTTTPPIDDPSPRE